uniref:Uncharacterized protein n=1 Tax=Lactuca sativa TaxID=4236 RepID=A0A9R1XMK5_LACSA|nr:hypothetical protein LSAT_V11C400225040 [Lactuca sativa]
MTTVMMIKLKTMRHCTTTTTGTGRRLGFRLSLSLYLSLSLSVSSLAPLVESIRWSTVGRYKVDVASFESLALPELQFKEDTDLFVIDEVGKMELFSSLFFPAVLRVLESKKINLRWLFLPTLTKIGRNL